MLPKSPQMDLVLSGSWASVVDVTSRALACTDVGSGYAELGLGPEQQLPMPGSHGEPPSQPD